MMRRGVWCGVMVSPALCFCAPCVLAFFLLFSCLWFFTTLKSLGVLGHPVSSLSLVGRRNPLPGRLGGGLRLDFCAACLACI
ncbi:uncharacterized protein BDZ99DRAFT_45195 [Mytilinidion resinicola]|uniref:Uncharacterized protein n=1 Tax=Mytilinidion resinicola TaxID=574789 RepID=A0A6A6YKL1_9PEZI|nr:uncharacterized protein BDZ99DRAFT_45195 [Mytilinidion resinicola]KAF2809089.1 hypothetical protein BDZ99DRAFT_45195 [Mytilinidion resinicola]